MNTGWAAGCSKLINTFIIYRIENQMKKTYNYKVNLELVVYQKYNIVIISASIEARRRRQLVFCVSRHTL